MLKAPKTDSSSNFTPHPAGTYMAVCCDVFTREKENKYKGTKNDRGVTDERDTITQVCISFLTEETIEIEGQQKPRYASFWAAFKMGTPDYPSKLREFVKGWFPSATDAQVEDMDLDNLVGKAAYLTVTQNEYQGKTYANVNGAATPPKGVDAPAIPADFVRHGDKDKPAAHPPVTNDPPAAYTPVPGAGSDGDDLPF